MNASADNGRDMTHTTDTNREFLLRTMRGATSTAYLVGVGWLIVVIDAAQATEAKPTDYMIALPYEDDALRRIYDATRSHTDSGAWDDGSMHYIATWKWYDADSDDTDIADAMAKYPCLVNYGGTLRAVNTEAGGSDVVLILKDMQA